VCHGSELPFVFHVFDDGVSLYYEPTADELQLSEDMANYWTNFVTNSDPNKGLATPAKFPLYLGSQDTILEMNEPGTVQESNFRDSYCDMWDRMGYFY
jgi:carboxylesterase type B